MSMPSFPSFPSFTTFPDLDPGPSTRTTGQQDEKGKKRQEREKKHRRTSGREEDRDADGERKRKKHKDDRHKERESSEGAKHHRRSSSRSPSRTQVYRYGGSDDERRKLEEDRRSRHRDKPNTMEGLVYFTDRKGDPLNVQYGGLHAGDVPKYRLVGGGRKVLGLSPILAVVHRGRGGIEVAPFGRRKMPALTDSSTRHMLSAGPKRMLLPTSDEKYKYPEIDGFLRITSNRPRKDDQPYREIELSKQELDSDESELELSEEYASSDDNSDPTPKTSLQSTLKSLEERLSENPRDIPAWLSLLSHTLSTTPTTSKNAPKTRADISLSVLSSAISAHPDNGRSRALRVRYMKAGEELWDRSTLRAKWEDAVKVDDTEIWMAWLDWSLRNTHAILESVVDDATRVSRALSTRGDEVGQLRVLWRVSVALRDAGYLERAHALLQAQAEFLYSMPQRLSNQPLEEQLDALEEFWDSEVPRLGESGARGWAAWDASNGVDQQSPPTNKRAAQGSRILDPYSRWAASEALADRTQFLSLRTIDEEEDPYAVILFSDVRPLLLPLCSQRARDVFRHIWLAFGGLHVPGFLASLSEHPEDNTDDRWAYSHLVSLSYLASVFPSDAQVRQITADSQAGVLVGREREYNSGFGPVKNWGADAIAPLNAMGSSRWMMWGSEDVQGVDAALVREIFRQCRLGGDDADWDVLNLAFEAAMNLKSAVKVSKSLLAGARDSLPHWAAHARLECLRGRYDDARKVYQTNLVATSQNRPGEGALWWDWAHMEWLARNDDVSLQVIIRSSGVTGSGGIATLRAKRHFETLLAPQSESGRSWKEREPLIKIAALLELLTSSSQSAVALFDTQLKAQQPGSPAHESLMVASLALLYNHAAVLRNPTPPALLRERVEGAIEMYPNNTAILGMFLEAEKGQSVWGRVRAMLGEGIADSTRKEKGVARRVAEVWVAGWEKGRWEAEVERVRSGLSAAVEDERTRGSAILWKLFVAFEVRAGQPERAKKLLFRAIGECPLVKDLYLLAFGPLRAVFSARELWQLGETMAERGVRMRVGLDEGVGDVEDNGERASEDGEEEDEIEARARELRRLMPY